ncbi:hypothetical protein MNV84_07546 [Leishmania braziliensis]|nr:hypothetical protein MNV84_07546 [Leishmania braziliensis]
MSSVTSAFDSFRCTYHGANDSVNDIDVDPNGGRLYAACSSGDVCVWDIQTQELKARLCHPQRVNAVRCFPLCNSAASCATPLQPPPAEIPVVVSDREDRDALNRDSVAHYDIRWVLTGSEDGVVVVWCPVTYRMQNMCRPCSAAITALQLIPEPSSRAASKEGASEMEHRTSDPRHRRRYIEVDDGPAICCAASLRNVCILRVTTASSELVLLRAFQHHALITALTYVAPSMSLSTPLLVVGQEEGTLCVWNCAAWTYHDTMPYPTGEVDVAADARDDPTSVHEPLFQHGRVSKTFLYNCRRCNPSSDQAPLAEEAPATASVNPSDYIREMPASLSAEAMSVLESNCGTLPHSAKQAFLEQQQQDQGGLRFPAAPRDWRYDSRRVTCLTASRSSTHGSRNSYLYSGHAAGEVLLWGSVRRELTLLLLLKKIVLFSPSVWVWHLCAVPTLHISMPQSSEQKLGLKAGAKASLRPVNSRMISGTKSKSTMPLSSTRCARAGVASPLSTTHVSPLELIVWSDSGAVEYVSTRMGHVLHRQGPGFVSAAACVWGSPTIAPPPAPGPVSTLGSDYAAAATSSTKPTSKRSGGAVGGGHASSLSAHQYLVMAGFDGRVERYDATEVLELVKSSGKLF